MLDHFGSRSQLHRQGGAAVGSAGSSGDPRPLAGDDAESDAEDAMAECADDFDEVDVLKVLAAKREEARVAGAEAEDHFAWKVMGGMWTRENLGVAFDSLRAEARSCSAEVFVARCWTIQPWPTSVFV